MSLGIYIHVPFCGRKCRYCDFYSVCYRKEQAELYVAAVIRNIHHYSTHESAVDTVYFGGGTPSLLSPEQVGGILNALRESFDVTADAEITLEANPGTLSYNKLSALRDAGINRLSIGVQSMKDDELRLLGRTHTAERAASTVRAAAEAGFGNISCDLMFALPGQTPEDIAYSIESLSALPIQHISAYMLKIEEGTPFAEDSEVLSSLPDEDCSADLYLSAVQLIEEKGFLQYEVSNFAVPGYESRHNCRYWKCLDYIGIGPSAHSCFGGKRFAADRDIESFISSPVQTTEITDEAPCGFEEYAMLRLRLTEGLDLRDAGVHRGALEKKLPQLIDARYISLNGDNVSLTKKGFLMSNQVIGYLIDF